MKYWLSESGGSIKSSAEQPGARRRTVGAMALLGFSSARIRVPQPGIQPRSSSTMRFRFPMVSGDDEAEQEPFDASFPGLRR